MPDRMGSTAEGTASARCRLGGCAVAEAEEDQEGRGAGRGVAAAAGRKRIRVRVKRIGLYIRYVGLL
jgi:hypothetical protein